MRPQIIAVDFDGTLFNGAPNMPLIFRLKAEQRRGNIVILWTCREGKGLQDAVAELRKVGFMPNYVNRNCPLGIKTMGYDTRKIFADVYIDDKNAR